MSLSLLICFLLLSLLISSSLSALLSPITKDQSTLPQYTLSLYLKTPLQPTKLLIDLGAPFSWLDCSHHNFTSSSYHSIPCNSSLCNSFDSHACSNCFDPPGPGCSNGSCAVFPENPVTHRATIAEPIVDSLALPLTDGRNPGRLALLPEFVFSCSDPSLLEGLSEGVTGLAGLGRSKFSLPAQVSTALSSPYLFALCLSGSPSAPGVAFFSTSGPYFFFPEIDLSDKLIYTQLILNPVGSTVINYTHPSDEYFIEVTSIKVNGRALQLNETLLNVDQSGFGGTKISTFTPYTLLQTSIYESFIKAFVNESAALNLTVTEPVKPFQVCYPADDVLSTPVGPAVPTVDLVMQNEDVFWRIFGSNSMVRIASAEADVWCLGFLDGGTNPRASIVIGGHQMEENLLQFDLESNKLGFTSSVLAHNTMCANFNFTTSDLF